jgi:hypothetical protein
MRELKHKEKQIAEAQQIVFDGKIQYRLHCLLAVLRTEEGRTVLAWMEELCKVNDDDFQGNSRDAYYSGMRSVFLRFKRFVQSLGREGFSLYYQAAQENMIREMDADLKLKKIIQEIREEKNDA